MSSVDQNNLELLVNLEDGVPKNFGRILRQRRMVKGRSLQNVADASGLSVGYISQIERDLAVPSLRALRAICMALDMPMRWLFGESQDEDSESDFIVRRDDRRRTDYNADQTVMELLTNDAAPHLQMIRVVIRPGGNWGRVPEVPEGKNYARCATVTSGRLRLKLIDSEHILNEGDSFAVGPVEFIGGACIGDQDCELIWVVTPPAY